jgi:hypothetical protein
VNYLVSCQVRFRFEGAVRVSHKQRVIEPRMRPVYQVIRFAAWELQVEKVDVIRPKMFWQSSAADLIENVKSVMVRQVHDEFSRRTQGFSYEHLLIDRPPVVLELMECLGE